jgi:hypothetical protein
MNRRYSIRLFRLYLILLTIFILCLWLIPSVLIDFNQKTDDIITYDEKFLDNHIYPPPSYISNWTINDYFIRKENLKKLQDEYAINKNQKTVIEYGFRNRKKENKSNYIILEYTKVFNQPKFCGKTQDYIFGKQCPFQNCR